MATRRVYKQPQGYRDGGAVPVADVVPVADAAPSPDARPSDNGDAVLRAIEGQRRAEEMRRQPQKAPSVEEYVDALPGLSDHKRAFLKQHAEMLHGECAEIMGHVYQAALEHGIADDSEEMNDFLVSTVRREMNLRRERLADAARSAAAVMMQAPPQPMPDIERMAEQLDHEASALAEIEHARNAAPAGLAMDYAPAPSPRAPSMPLVAPVARDAPSLGGRRAVDLNSVTLSAEERQIARNAFTNPNMSNAERERLYAINKRKLYDLRRAGLYPERERG